MVTVKLDGAAYTFDSSEELARILGEGASCIWITKDPDGIYYEEQGGI